METEQIIEYLKSVATEDHLHKLAHFGINDTKALGVSVPVLRKLAKEIGINHPLALKLWETEIHEARLLASIIADPHQITEHQFDSWVNDFDSWDMCDICCTLLVKTPFAFEKIEACSSSTSTYVKRTAFSLMCVLAFHAKKLRNEDFYHFFGIIEREAWDDRNFVRKALNWALRQIGKRNEVLRLKAIETAQKIAQQHTKSARWIAADALRELNDPKVIARVRKSKK